MKNMTKLHFKRPGFRATKKEYQAYKASGQTIGLMSRWTPIEIQEYCYSKFRPLWRVREPFEALRYDIRHWGKKRRNY
jgi:hypothetical protein